MSRGIKRAKAILLQRCPRCLEGLVYALTPGEGPSRNPKQQKNEDSLAVLIVPGGAAAVVADSHWGAWSGEALARATASALAARLPATHVALAELLLDLDQSYRM